MQWNLHHSRQYRRTDIFFQELTYNCECSVQSCAFFQCWPGIHLVQCRGNFFNVQYQKINWSKTKIAEKWRCSNDNALKFLRTILPGVFWAIHWVLAVQCYSRVLRQHQTGFCPMQCCLRLFGEHCTRFLPVQCCPKSVRTTLNRIFLCAMLSQEY